MTGEVPVRTRAMEDLVERMDRAAGTVRPNLAVRFAADPNVPQVNRHGVVQYGCTFVGECVIGCNQGAKNSLDYNYLAIAERAGAVAVTAAEVIRIEPCDTDPSAPHDARRRYDSYGNERWIEVRPPDQDLLLVLSPRQADEPRRTVPDRLPHSDLFFDCADIESTHAELSARGVKFPLPPARQHFGWWALFEDNEGTRYALGQWPMSS